MSPKQTFRRSAANGRFEPIPPDAAPLTNGRKAHKRDSVCGTANDDLVEGQPGHFEMLLSKRAAVNQGVANPSSTSRRLAKHACQHGRSVYLDFTDDLKPMASIKRYVRRVCGLQIGETTRPIAEAKAMVQYDTASA